jgi:archaellum component FlaC
MDLHCLSVFFRENNKKLHNDTDITLAFYRKFKITNSMLRTLKENFFMEQVKRKLEDKQSNWDVDQIEALEKYRNEWESYDKTQKREITSLKKRLESINKEYKSIKKSYKSHFKQCLNLKNKIEELVESKSAFESVINLLMKEKETVDLYNPGSSPPKKKIPFNKSIPVY